MFHHKNIFILAFFCLVSALVYGQDNVIVRASKLMRTEPMNAKLAIDSAATMTEFKIDFYTHTIKAFIYYELFKKTDKLKLNSYLRDTILSALKRSNSLKPDEEVTKNNKRMYKSLSSGYYKLAKTLLEDSGNYQRSELAFKRSMELMKLQDSTLKPEAKQIEYYSAVISFAQNKYLANWKTKKQLDTNDFIFIKNQVQKIRDIANQIIEPPEKELPIMDKNYLDEVVKPVNKSQTMMQARLFESFLITSYYSIKQEILQNENIQRQVALQISKTKNDLARLQLEKQSSEIAMNKMQIQEKNKNLILLNKDKALKSAFIAKQKAEAEKREKTLKQQKIIRNLSLLGILLLVLVLVIIYRSLHQKRQQNAIITAKNIEVEKQHQLISKQKHQIEEKHKEITDSINYAERIQKSFLASTAYLDKQLKDYFVFFKPKDVVSGDFYWADTIGAGDNSKFVLCVADSTGHGVPGAIMSLLNITSLEKAIEEKAEAADILNHTRQTIIERLKKDGSPEGGKDGMDCSLMIFDRAKSQLTYAAANNPVWLVRDQNLIELEADKMPVGKHDFDKKPFSQQSITLQKGDCIYALTDGFPDQFGGPKNKKFMYKKLKELILSIHSQNMNAQKQHIDNVLKDWMKEAEQVDDITLVGVRWGISAN